MKTHLILLLFLISSILISGCQKSTAPSTDEFQNVSGIVIKKTILNLYFIALDIPVDNISEFYPENMADAFKRDSLRVRFSGKITTPPDPPAPYLSVKLSSIEIISK